MINEQIKAGYKLLAVLKTNPEIIEESKSLAIENPFYNEETNTFFRIWKEEMKVNVKVKEGRKVKKGQGEGRKEGR